MAAHCWTRVPHVVALSDPLPNARRFVAENFSHSESDLIMHHGGSFNAWSDRAGTSRARRFMQMYRHFDGAGVPRCQGKAASRSDRRATRCMNVASSAQGGSASARQHRRARVAFTPFPEMADESSRWRTGCHPPPRTTTTLPPPVWAAPSSILAELLHELVAPVPLPTPCAATCAWLVFLEDLFGDD